jgi:hypothetical protein
MLVINGLNDIEFTCGTEEKCRGTWNRKTHLGLGARDRGASS